MSLCRKSTKVGILDAIPRIFTSLMNKLSLVLLMLGLFSLYLTRYNNESLPIAVATVIISLIMTVVTAVMLRYQKD